ncbi:putative membrane protein YeiB [Mycetocola sp. CAN_C7]|uniref:hypothetical protein n=1 Tax=Mycetocola sp. CAN_C7 TaxID=2787724 RepID=UPI0018CAC6BC
MITEPGRVSVGRIAGIDIARGVAILGMFFAHTVPRDGDAELLVDGRPSLLFATLAGISLGLLSGADRPFPPGSRGRTRRVILVRSLGIFLLGVVLGTMGSEVSIILDYYAIMFLILLPMLFLARPVLAAIAGVFLVGAPMVADLVDPGEDGGTTGTDVLRDYLLTGTYPALVWLPVLIAGLIVARSGLGRRRTQLWMIGGGAASALLGYGMAAVLPGVTAAAHSSSMAEIVGSGGAVMALTGLILLATSGEGPGRLMRRLLWPVGATGALALTVYTVQIVVLAMVAGARDAGGPDYPGWPLLITLAVASVAGASVWRLVVGRGPLERLLSLAAGRR